jgi:hypothetical protein
MQLLTCDICETKILWVNRFESLVRLMNEIQAKGEAPELYYSEIAPPKSCPHCCYPDMDRSDVEL